MRQLENSPPICCQKVFRPTFFSRKSEDAGEGRWAKRRSPPVAKANAPRRSQSDLRLYPLLSGHDHRAEVSASAAPPTGSSRRAVLMMPVCLGFRGAQPFVKIKTTHLFSIANLPSVWPNVFGKVVWTSNSQLPLSYLLAVGRND
jgi:hypothetical protein